LGLLGSAQFFLREAFIPEQLSQLCFIKTLTENEMPANGPWEFLTRIAVSSCVWSPMTTPVRRRKLAPSVFAKSERILRLTHRRSDMKKFLTTLAVLAAFATPALAQSFDPDNGTGNVLSFGAEPIAPQKDKVTVHQSASRAYGMVPRSRATRHALHD
jgi:hypothetical protein